MTPSRKGWPPRHVLITGASSGIGAALARELAASGAARLSLQGRDAARLEALAAELEAPTREVHAQALDVRDRAAMAGWIEAAHAAMPLDLVVANAGISGGGEARDARTILAVNVEGVMNTAEPAIPLMAGRGGGLALMGSLAGLRGMPSAPAYCASKAAVGAYAQALRGRLMADGIVVSLIMPGFVATPLTAANPFPMPFLMTPERAARRIARGLERGRARIAFPRRLYWPLRLIAALPPSLADPWLARAASKE